MKHLLIALALASPLHAQVLRQNGQLPSIGSPLAFTSTVTLTGTGSACFSADSPTLKVDCGLHQVIVAPAVPADYAMTIRNASSGASRPSTLKVIQTNASTTVTDNIFNVGTNAKDVLTVEVNGVGFMQSNPGAQLDVLSEKGQAAYVLSVSSQSGVVGSVFGVTAGGHVVSSGTTPAVVCDAGTPAMAADSNDMSGQFTGGALSANCTVTFATPFSKKPRCWCNDETAILVIQAITTTTTLKCTAAVSIGTDVITYGCNAAP